MTDITRNAMATPPTRRRAIRILAGAAGVFALGGGVRALAPPARFFHWRGDVLGASAEIALWHADAAFAANSIRRIGEELARLHRIFSLSDPQSEISRLNRDGALEQSSPEMLTLVRASLALGALSGGAFDISVQPLWRIYEAHFWSKSDIAPDIAARALGTARTLVDYRAIEANGRRIAFARPGMGITLNGIAQGFITDVIAQMLLRAGFGNSFIDLGEMRALGAHPGGRPWSVGLKDPARPSALARALEISDSALAVSGGYGTTFDPGGRFHHIFNPRTGDSAREFLDVAVIGPFAAAADGLSTALYAAGEANAAALIAAHPGYRALATRADGSIVSFTAEGARDGVWL